MFEGFLTVRERCDVCGLGLAGHDAGDGPAVFGIFILGFGVVGLAGFVEYLFAPPLWLHVLVWTPVIAAGGLLLLRPLKGLTVAIQYRCPLDRRGGAPRRHVRRTLGFRRQFPLLSPARRGGSDVSFPGAAFEAIRDTVRCSTVNRT